MTDTPIPGTRLAEALAEIERLRAAELEAVATMKARDLVAWDEIRHLRARILELEAEHAITHGTLAQPTPDEPATITHNVKPSAPPHGE